MTQDNRQERKQASAAHDDGERLRTLRKHSSLTQGEAAEALGISAAYWGELERGEKPIDVRLRQRIDDALRTRIDVSYSEALGGWTVSLTTVLRAGPGQRPGRRHEVIAKYADLEDAEARAKDVRDDREPFARIMVHPRRQPPPMTTAGRYTG
ncbi:helix-turn-helix domain-containing protein [Sphingomonas sp.]|uniref:helix-turn-helix domain-containing protein n=1 Tax=Sphingomonas sp. TaxID=28214 RepID=UPI003F6E947A